MISAIAQIFQFNWYAVPVLVVGILMFLISLFILSQNRRSSVNLSFFLIGLCGLLWFSGIFATYSAKTPGAALFSYRVLTFFGVSLIAPCVYYFSATWLNLFEKQKRTIGLSFLGGLAFYIVGLFSHWSFPGVRQYFWGFYPVYGPINYGFMLFFFLVLARAFTNFFKALFKEPKGVRKTQIGLITTGFLVSFAASLDYIPKLVEYPVYPLGFLTVFFWILVVAYAIIRYRAMDIETAIHKTLMWMVTTAVAIVPFAVVIYGTQRFFITASFIGLTFYFLALAIAFYIYFRALQPLLDQLFQRQRKNLRALLNEFSRELVHLKNLRDLLQRFSRMLRRELYVRQLSVYLLDEKRDEFVPMIVKGLQRLRAFPNAHPFLRWLEKNDEVIVGNLIGANPEIANFKETVTEYLTATQAMVVIPFALGGKLIGFANLGKKSNLRKYGFRETQFFNRLKSPLTIAFSNSMRYEEIRSMSEELRRWNVELEKRVEDRTRELVKTQEQLIQAEKLATLGTLAGGVAHEINNPLTAVLTNAQILKMTASAEMRESLSLIEEGAKRCQVIVQKLMKYARKTAEEAPHRLVDLNEVVKGTCSLLGFQFQQENIQIEMRLASVPAVLGVANELEQVLTNLLVNARDAILAAKVPGRILVETRTVKSFVELIVQDNGIGIAKENLKKIFDPFFTTKDIGAGTGLGLAVSFGILKRHQADLHVDSTPGKGATFTLKFPLALDKAES